ncbi:MAG: hypothetical protein OXH96_21850 [Spirochaetaceae bacterium]|nr:hypothetical protein [Spirochaetaceae bacterium]
MTSYVLDTDTLSLLQRGNATVGARFGQYDADESQRHSSSMNRRALGAVLPRRRQPAVGPRRSD